MWEKAKAFFADVRTRWRYRRTMRDNPDSQTAYAMLGTVWYGMIAESYDVWTDHVLVRYTRNGVIQMIAHMPRTNFIKFVQATPPGYRSTHNKEKRL